MTPVLRAAPRAALAAACFALTALLVARYPLSRPMLGAALGLYGLALWYRPGLWLLVVPAVLPAVDLTVWSGWLMVSESDAFLLVTLGVLVLRAPPAWEDLRLRGFPGVVLGLTVLAYAVGVARGLASPYVLAHGSANPYLLPINALRLAKGVVWALVLLALLRARQRRHGDALVRFGVGMVASLALVALAALVERAVFPGVFNFGSAYRVAATFSSMQFGSDDIGTYLAMTLPFLAVGLPRPRPGRLALEGLVAAGGLYALLVTYSRTAYVAAVLGTVSTLVLLWPLARRRGLAAVAVVVAVFGLVAGTTVVFALDSGVMQARLARAVPAFHARFDNWAEGLALMDRSPAAMLFGMGLGTYPRVARLRAPAGFRPSNFLLRHGRAGPYLRIRSASHLYFGQKVPVRPNRTYRLSLAWRVLTPGGALTAALCEKLLLYSDTCDAVTFRPRRPGGWHHADVALSTQGMEERVVAGVLRRPVELALFAAGPGETVDFAAVRLVGPRGRNLVRNGRFRHGTDRWYPTDDSHLAWQIWNQYLTTLFEGGAFGLAAYLLLAGAAFAGAARAALRGVPMAAPIAGSVLAFLACGVFDDELAAPRMVTLFYLIAFAGLSLWGMEGASDRRPRTAGVR